MSWDFFTPLLLWFEPTEACYSKFLHMTSTGRSYLTMPLTPWSPQCHWHRGVSSVIDTLESNMLYQYCIFKGLFTNLKRHIHKILTFFFFFFFSWFELRWTKIPGRNIALLCSGWKLWYLSLFFKFKKIVLIPWCHWYCKILHDKVSANLYHGLY